MSPQHQSPGANVAAAAAPRAKEAEASSTPPEPAEEAPNRAAAPEAESGAAPSSPPTAAATAEAPKEGVVVSTAVATTPPGDKADTGVDGRRPHKPILVGAALLGAVLIAVPLLLAGGANDERRHTPKGLAEEGSYTVLNPESAPAGLEDYVAEKPSPPPSKEEPKKSAAPAPEPRTSSPQKPRPEAKPTPKPKAAPKPNWSTETVFAPSVLEVNQAWTTNRIRMVMQTDGNLVVYNEDNNAIWASMTFGENHRAIFQTDGNLVIHNAADHPIWSSRSEGHAGAQLVLRADAKVVIVHNGGVVWST